MWPPCALCTHHVSPGDPYALLLLDDKFRAAIELVHNVEDVLLKVPRRGPGREHAADPKMRHCPLVLGDERIRRLSDTVVKECVSAVRAQHEAGLDGVPERRVRRLLGLSAYPG